MMKRLSIILIVTAILVLTAATAALAVPPFPGDEGQLVIFGDYSTYHGKQFGLGVGYQITDTITAGAEYYLDGCIILYADASFGNFLVDGEVSVEPGSFNWVKVAGFYNFNMEQFSFAAGGGVSTIFSDFEIFLKAGARMELGDGFFAYGTVEYYPTFGELEFTGGLSMVLPIVAKEK